MLACKVKNLFGSNDYCEGKIASHIINFNGINYVPFDYVKIIGFIYDREDIEEIDYVEPVKNTKTSTLAVSYKNIFGDNKDVSNYDYLAIEKDGIKYLIIDAIRNTSLVIVGCDIEEVSL